MVIILWSWHIWVLGDAKANTSGNMGTPDHIATALSGTDPIMMDRALGAIATGTEAVKVEDVGNDPTAIATAQAKANAEAVKRFGMHYQWGRKDPFTPAMAGSYYGTEVQIYNANGIAITKGPNGIATTEKLSEFKFEARTTTNQTTINHLIQNPSTHYYKGDGTNQVPIATTEYYNTTKEGDWWNPTIKTIYDPCPNGYRIPEDGTYGTGSNITTHKDWSDWSDGGLKSGRTFKNLSFFPASGNRNGSNGYFSVIGSYGYSWMSASQSSVNGYILRFLHDVIYPDYKLRRADGMPLRCIKE